jgi:hypothetical protein
MKGNITGKTTELDISEVQFPIGLILAKTLQEKLPGFEIGKGRSPLGKLLDEMFYKGMSKDALINILNDITLLANETVGEEDM